MPKGQRLLLLFVIGLQSVASFVVGPSWRKRHQLYASGEEQIRVCQECFPIHVIASPEVFLPGESITLSLPDENCIPLIEDLLKQDCSNLALAVQLEDSTVHYEEDWTVAQVSTLCEIAGITLGSLEDDVQLKLRCVGRVRLERMLKSYSPTHFQFTAGPILEPLVSKEDQQKALLVQENIDLLMNQLSDKEKELISGNGEKIVVDPRSHQGSLHHKYLATRKLVLDAISADATQKICERDLLELTATSWSVFLSLDDCNLEVRYRLRALDWDNLLERLKLAQYALREKALLMQGQALKAQNSTPSEHRPSPDSVSEAFQ